jgi:hypothetical protein
MKKIFVSILCLIALLGLSTVGQSINLYGKASNFTLDYGNAGSSVCFPINGAVIGYPSAVDCTSGLGQGFGSAPVTKTYSKLTIVISPEVPSTVTFVQVLFENATQTTVPGYCLIYPGHSSCTISTSLPVTAFDKIAIAFRSYSTGSTVTINNASWVLE